MILSFSPFFTNFVPIFGIFCLPFSSREFISAPARLDNNRLQRKVPEGFGFSEFVSELNLESNNMNGRVPFPATFTAKIGEKLRLKGNLKLCVDEKLSHGKSIGSSSR
ncbi:hypothetical protein J1N35_021223 [Gossypium stocksii]|uniref:Uncharacterized protein n=1 Tax=Gossypium stocksii TaxID=47602 RepID=A0A9D3VG25_9ROSI|nr:hypothetical protein J1N35_021223 [Gossypium stocksii]